MGDAKDNYDNCIKNEREVIELLPFAKFLG
jgi:hypothetical protein